MLFVPVPRALSHSNFISQAYSIVIDLHLAVRGRHTECMLLISNIIKYVDTKLKRAFSDYATPKFYTYTKEPWH